MREQLVKLVEIIPIEFIIRNIATGSLTERLGIEDGTVLETVEGVYGAHCENLTSEVEDSLGVVYFKEETSDRYVTNRIGQEQHVTL